MGPVRQAMGDAKLSAGDLHKVLLVGGSSRSLLEPLHGHLVAGQVHALGLLELGHHPVHNALVKVVAAQTG